MDGGWPTQRPRPRRPGSLVGPVKRATALAWGGGPRGLGAAAPGPRGPLQTRVPRNGNEALPRWRPLRIASPLPRSTFATLARLRLAHRTANWAAMNCGESAAATDAIDSSLRRRHPLWWHITGEGQLADPRAPDHSARALQPDAEVVSRAVRSRAARPARPAEGNGGDLARARPRS